MQWREVRFWIPAIPLRPRIRLSTLLILIVAAAIAAAWRSDHRKLSARLAQLERKGTWGVAEATGPPDTIGYGDKRSAWASKAQDNQIEWLQLDYGAPITPVAVVIHETYCPGALMRVAAVGPDDRETTLWEGVDPIPSSAAGGVARVTVAPDTPIERIKVYLDSPNVPGWNEVDAVGLELADGRIEWATSATASSSYGPSTPSSKPAARTSPRLITVW